MMDHEIEAFIRDLLRRHNLLTLATVREDGLPQGDHCRLCQRRPGALPGTRLGPERTLRINCLARASSDGEGLKSLSPDRDQLPNHRTEDLQK
jgi:hypothetical protein